jgi:hypothetical protein
MWSILPIIAKLLGIISGIMSWLKLRAAKQEGRTEERLAQAEKTVEVISRNVEGKQAVDEMTEEESIADLTKP